MIWVVWGKYGVDGEPFWTLRALLRLVSDLGFRVGAEGLGFSV